jgi:hypothetical protein
VSAKNDEIRLVAELDVGGQSRVGHFAGFPPGLYEGSERTELPPARWIAITGSESAGFSLDRFSDRGEFAGDTWHPTIEEARAQAAYEYPTTVLNWTSVPDDVADVNAFVNGLARRG